MKIVRVAILIFCLYSLVNSQKVRTCYHEKKRISGICVFVLDCQSAVKEIESGILPQICGYVNQMQPIVCCERLLRKSEAKCREYAKSVYQNISLPHLGLIPTYVTRDVCGIKPTKLIIGGVEAEINEFPHMAILGYDRPNGTITYSCAGSLISENFVVTAAHCVRHPNYGEVNHVILGEHDQSTDDETDVQIFSVAERIVHEDYKNIHNDIALIKLHENATFTQYVRPICIHTKNIELTEKFIATGWGRTSSENRNTSEVLLKVTLDYFSNEECNATYGSKWINDKKLCAGSRQSTKDTCKGDSGGPLQIHHDDIYCTYLLVGITSFGKGCGVKGQPAVYTRVAEYVDWIENIVWP